MTDADKVKAYQRIAENIINCYQKKSKFDNKSIVNIKRCHQLDCIKETINPIVEVNDWFEHLSKTAGELADEALKFLVREAFQIEVMSNLNRLSD
jgi:hypothetical protein